MAALDIDVEDVPLPPLLIDLLSQDGFTIFVKGPKEMGKTNLAMLIMEICQGLELRKFYATNIKTECYYVEQITNKPDLDQWLNKKHGKKTFAMDELGKNLRKFGFASKRNQDMMDVIQLIRHFDCGFIGMAPASKFVDSGFLIANDILDAEIRKLSKGFAKVIDYYHGETYFWRDIPATSIKYDSKDIAKFDMEKEEDTTKLPLCCQVAARAAKFKEADASMAKIGAFFNLNAEQTKRELIKHLKHQKNFFHASQTPEEVDVHEKSEKSP